MNKYFKLDKDKREIILDKTKKYNVNVDILDLIIDLQQEIDKLTKKCEILEENNKLLIQQKAQMYEDLDIAYRRIDKAIEYIKSHCEIIRYKNYDKIGNVDGAILLSILGDKE